MVWDPSKFFGGEAAASRKYDRDNPARYAPKAGSLARLRHYSMTDKAPATTAASQKAHAASDKKMQYDKPVRSRTEKTARG
jgi:hypothetical protein